MTAPATPATLDKPADPIEIQLEVLDQVIAKTNSSRDRMLAKLETVVNDQLDKIDELNAGKVAGVASLLSTWGGMLHQHEATAVQRVKLETGRKQVANEEAVNLIAISMLRKMRGEPSDYQNPVVVDINMLNSADEELALRASQENFKPTDGEIEKVDVEAMKAQTDAIGRKIVGAVVENTEE